MKVLFLARVHNVAERGEVKDVAEGYARNYLLPNGFAVPLTPAVLQSQKQQAAHRRKQQEEGDTKQRRLLHDIRGRTFRCRERANEQGRLFAGVTPQKVSAILARDGLEVPASAVVLSGSIKELGEYAISVHFAGGEAVFNLIIERDL